MELSGKTVVLTGASRGIGQALARELAQAGCRLMLTAIEADELTAITKELRAISADVLALPIDLTNAEERKKGIKWIQNAPHPVDILINNAGMGGHFGRFSNQNWDNIEHVISLNIIASIHLTRAIIPILKNRVQAKIVNISSGIARLPYPGLAIYGGTKGFISSFSESLICELSNTNVSVLCFHPGFTRTAFIETSKMDLQKIPNILIHRREDIAKRIVTAIIKDKVWEYSDFMTRFSTWLGFLLPERLKLYLFRDLFWRLPDEK
jgi:short-subunit dehydrogenase